MSVARLAREDASELRFDFEEFILNVLGLGLNNEFKKTGRFTHIIQFDVTIPY